LEKIKYPSSSRSQRKARLTHGKTKSKTPSRRRGIQKRRKWLKGARIRKLRKRPGTTLLGREEWGGVRSVRERGGQKTLLTTNQGVLALIRAMKAQ